jgi:hypothetical protein
MVGLLAMQNLPLGIAQAMAMFSSDLHLKSQCLTKVHRVSGEAAKASPRKPDATNMVGSKIMFLLIGEASLGSQHHGPRLQRCFPDYKKL